MIGRKIHILLYLNLPQNMRAFSFLVALCQISNNIVAPYIISPSSKSSHQNLNFSSKNQLKATTDDSAFIASGDSLSGDYSFTNSLEIAGKFSGSINNEGGQGARVIITESGTCQLLNPPTLQNMDELDCDGVFWGNVNVRKLRIGPNGKVIGDVLVQSLKIDEGGKVIGNVRVGEEREYKVAINEIINNSGANSGANANANANTHSDNSFVPQFSQNSSPSFSRTATSPSPSPSPSSPSAHPKSNNSNSDNFGNPLIRVPSSEAVDMFKRNREEMNEVRDLMEMTKNGKKKKSTSKVSFNSPQVDVDASKDDYDWREVVTQWDRILGVNKKKPSAQSRQDDFNELGITDDKASSKSTPPSPPSPAPPTIGKRSRFLPRFK